jgi:hypothetical protein
MLLYRLSFGLVIPVLPPRQWVPMCPRTESAMSVWSCACMGKCCPYCVEHSGAGFDSGRGSRRPNSRSIVSAGMDDESEGTSGDVISEFGVGLPPTAMTPGTSLSAFDGNQGLQSRDARVRFAVEDDELGGLQEYADFDSEAAAAAMEGAAFEDDTVMERELTSVPHGDSSAHSTSSYVAME